MHIMCIIAQRQRPPRRGHATKARALASILVVPRDERGEHARANEICVFAYSAHAKEVNGKN